RSGPQSHRLFPEVRAALLEPLPERVGPSITSSGQLRPLERPLWADGVSLNWEGEKYGPRPGRTDI
ncbi:hypothetical protein NDU88_002462, partial [Pleurodeles waltl]